LPHDTFMSGVHFAVECGSGGCRVVDRKSSNGTFLNGGRIQDAMLANGDEIKGGQTVFGVKIVADAKLASLVPPQQVAPSPAAPPPAALAFPAPLVAPPADAPLPASPERSPAPELARPSAQPQIPAAAKPVPPPAADKHSRGVEASPPSGGPVRPMAAADSALGLAPLQIEEAKRPRVGTNPPVAGENLPAAGAKAPRVTEQQPANDAPPVVAVSSAPPASRKSGGEVIAAPPLARETGGSRGSAFSVMGWSFPAAPAEWQVQEGFGLQQSGHEEFPSSVAASEELLGGISLQQFVESQISMLRGYLRDPKIEPTMPPRVGGADESMAMDVRHSTKDGRELVYRRIYARSGSSVGVLTVTTLAAELPQVLQSLQPLLEGAAFHSTGNG
jgi:FHA domain